MLTSIKLGVKIKKKRLSTMHLFMRSFKTFRYMPVDCSEMIICIVSWPEV